MASSQIKRKLVVCGGNGFLGSQICRSAVNRGWNVVSISRSGSPPQQPANSNSWENQVNWEKADVFDPSTYLPHIRGADAVVHSMGILLEADYKKILQTTEGPMGVLSNLVKSVSPTVAKTMDGEDPADDARHQKSQAQLSYQRMNTESALTLARAVVDTQKTTEAQQEGSSQNPSPASKSPKHTKVPFVYVSSAGSFPLLPAGYINSKRAAEAQLQAPEFTDYLEPLFLRPGYMTPSSDSPTTPRSLISIPISVGSYVASIVDDTVGRGRLSSLIGEAATTRTASTDTVGAAVVELLARELDGESSGIGPDHVVTARDISRLASIGWRKGGLA